MGLQQAIHGVRLKLLIIYSQQNSTQNYQFQPCSTLFDISVLP